MTYVIKGPHWTSFRSRLGFYLCLPALAGAIFFLAPNMVRFLDILNFERFLKKQISPRDWYNWTRSNAR